MKQLLFMALAVMSLQLHAQDQKDLQDRKHKMERAERMKDYTPEEIAELQTKQMTLHLDLTEAQQRQIMAINVEQAKARKAAMETRKKHMESGEKVKPSKEERLKMKNEMLDRQIALKKQMKAVLNSEQYQKWEAMVKEKMDRRRHDRKKGMRKE